MEILLIVAEFIGVVFFILLLALIMEKGIAIVLISKAKIDFTM